MSSTTITTTTAAATVTSNATNITTSATTTTTTTITTTTSSSSSSSSFNLLLPLHNFLPFILGYHIFYSLIFSLLLVYPFCRRRLLLLLRVSVTGHILLHFRMLHYSSSLS